MACRARHGHVCLRIPLPCRDPRTHARHTSGRRLIAQHMDVVRARKPLVQRQLLLGHPREAGSRALRQHASGSEQPRREAGRPSAGHAARRQRCTWHDITPACTRGCATRETDTELRGRGSKARPLAAAALWSSCCKVPCHPRDLFPFLIERDNLEVVRVEGHLSQLCSLVQEQATSLLNLLRCPRRQAVLSGGNFSQSLMSLTSSRFWFRWVSSLL